VKRGGCGLGEVLSKLVKFYPSYGKDLRSARKDADVEKQEGESCAGMEERLKTRGVARTLKQQEGGRTTTWQMVLLRELSSRQNIMIEEGMF
jgi:hypothetical protein